jgi:RNA polymerase sigma-70 factor (sigma-E family)
VDSGTERDFKAFVAQSTPALFRVAFALTGQQHAAEDLLQSALERVYVRGERLSDPAGYTKRVMYHEYVSWWRRWRRREVPMAVLPELSDADSAGHVLLRRALHAALRGLPPRQRAVLVLRYFDDLSVAETAAVMRCSEGTVKSQTARGLSALRAAVARLSTADHRAASQPHLRGTGRDPATGTYGTGQDRPTVTTRVNSGEADRS